MSAAALCLLYGAATVAIPADHFTLAWTHSVEKIEWQEDYALDGGRLKLLEARVQGSGAGMEAPDGARLAAGWWRYTPDLPPLDGLRLTLSPHAADYRLCVDGGCTKLTELVGAAAPDGMVVVQPCAAAQRE